MYLSNIQSKYIQNTIYFVSNVSECIVVQTIFQKLLKKIDLIFTYMFLKI